MKRYSLFVLLFFLFLTVNMIADETICLKDQFARAEPGSYLVIEQNKIYTVLHIYDKTPTSLILEEVNVPQGRKDPSLSWKEWFEQGGPNNTSWVMSDINLQTGLFEESFSFTRQGWLDTSRANDFMSTLLNLNFYQVPEDKRRKVGSAPSYGKADRRKNWNPRMIVDGETLPGINFTAWRARWPNDGSELARKIVEIYLPDGSFQHNYPSLPSYFPYWLEVEGKLGTATVRVVDSGTAMQSPKPAMPRRSAYFSS